MLGQGMLRALLDGTALDRGMDAAVEHVMAGFMSLPLHPDVVDGVSALRQAGLRLVTLTNGSAHVAESLFGTAEIRNEFEVSGVIHPPHLHGYVPRRARAGTSRPKVTGPPCLSPRHEPATEEHRRGRCRAVQHSQQRRSPHVLSDSPLACDPDARDHGRIG